MIILWQQRNCKFGLINLQAKHIRIKIKKKKNHCFIPCLCRPALKGFTVLTFQLSWGVTEGVQSGEEELRGDLHCSPQILDMETAWKHQLWDWPCLVWCKWHFFKLFLPTKIEYHNRWHRQNGNFRQSLLELWGAESSPWLSKLLLREEAGWTWTQS